MGLRGWCQATTTPTRPNENQSKACPRSEGANWCAAEEITAAPAITATASTPTASAPAGPTARGSRRVTRSAIGPSLTAPPYGRSVPGTLRRGQVALFGYRDGLDDLRQYLTAVDHDRLPRDVTRLLAGQEQRGVADVVDAAQASQRYRRRHLGRVLLAERGQI